MEILIKCVSGAAEDFTNLVLRMFTEPPDICKVKKVLFILQVKECMHEIHSFRSICFTQSWDLCDLGCGPEEIVIGGMCKVAISVM